MKSYTVYEWCFRTIVNEYGDCENIDHCNSLAGHNFPLNDDEELELCKMVGDSWSGEDYRVYANVDHFEGKLDEFTNGSKVPKKYRKQFDSWLKRCNGNLGGHQTRQWKDPTGFSA